MPAAHEVYAEQLRELRRGSPLWHPEPRPEGPVEIGDVGYTKDGAFRRIFNVSKPADDPVQRFGVPNGFVQLDLGVVDKFDAVLEPGPLHSRTISTLSTTVGTPGEFLPAEASFRFGCSSKRGAILMLETQMTREEAVQSRHLEDYAVKHCRSWHSFARDLGIHIGFGDLILVTECSKTAAWSSVVYSNSSTEFGLSFSVGMPFSAAGISASSSLEKIGPVERRRSQKRAHTHDQPLPKDHTVFIKGYRVGMRQMSYSTLLYLFMKARGSSITPGDREGIDGTGSRSPSAASGSSSPPIGFGGSSVIGPYEPDFNPSHILLALELEKNRDQEFVVLHDNVWCSMAPDSDEARLMDQYTDFYFSDEVTAYLGSMLGPIPYDLEFEPSDADESFLSHYPDLDDEDAISDDQSMDPASSLSDSPLELISPALLAEGITSHSKSSHREASVKTTNRENNTFESTKRFAQEVTWRSIHGVHEEPGENLPPDLGQSPTQKQSEGSGMLQRLRKRDVSGADWTSQRRRTVGISGIPMVRKNWLSMFDDNKKGKSRETFVDSEAHHHPLHHYLSTQVDSPCQILEIGRAGAGKSTLMSTAIRKAEPLGEGFTTHGGYCSRRKCVGWLLDLCRGHPFYHPEPRSDGRVEVEDVRYTGNGAFNRLFKAPRDAPGSRHSSATDHPDVRRLLREVRVWSHLNHPNILPLFGITYGFGAPGAYDIVDKGGLSHYLNCLEVIAWPERTKIVRADNITAQSPKFLIQAISGILVIFPHFSTILLF